MAISNSTSAAIHNFLPGPIAQHDGTPTVEPHYSFKGNDTRTVLDVKMPGVKKPGISVHVAEDDLVIVGRCYSRSKPHLTAPSMQYYLRVQLASPVDRRSVTAVHRGSDVLRITVPAT